MIGDVRETLEPALAAAGVDLFVHDSLIEPERERFEFDCALRHHGASPLVLWSMEGRTGALASFAADHGTPTSSFEERPLNHYRRGNELVLAVVGPLSSELPFA